MKTISVMIPCYNEEENVQAIYEAVRDELKHSCPKYDYEILFIDNKSTDNTRSILRSICEKDRHVKVIFNVKNFGQFNSPYHGILNTSGDCTITMCADFQDPVELIPEFVRAWEDGYKVVIGQKSQSREAPILFFLRSVYYKMIRSMSTVELIEHFTGFGLYDRSFVDILRRLDDSTPFIRGVVAEFAANYKIIEYVQPKRRAGKTHNNFYTLYDAAMLSFTSYTKAGMRLATFFGFFVAFLSFLTALGFFIAKLVNWDFFSAGYVPIIITVFFMGGVQLSFLGFLGEYVMSMNTRIMHRPLVIEEERLNFVPANADAREDELLTTVIK